MNTREQRLWDVEIFLRRELRAVRDLAARTTHQSNEMVLCVKSLVAIDELFDALKREREAHEETKKKLETAELAATKTTKLLRGA